MINFEFLIYSLLAAQINNGNIYINGMFSIFFEKKSKIIFSAWKVKHVIFSFRKFSFKFSTSHQLWIVHKLISLKIDFTPGLTLVIIHDCFINAMVKKLVELLGLMKYVCKILGCCDLINLVPIRCF